MAYNKNGKVQVSRLLQDEGAYDFLLMNENGDSIEAMAEAFQVNKATICKWRKWLRDGIFYQKVNELLVGSVNRVPEGAMLLARTCMKCGLLLDGKWFPKMSSRSSNKGHVCRLCSAKRTSAKSKAESALKRNDRLNGHNRRQIRKQNSSLAGAYRHGQLWTHQDLKMLAEPGRVEDKARKMGRTYNAIASAAVKYRKGVKEGLPKDLSSEQWVIYFNKAS